MNPQPLASAVLERAFDQDQRALQRLVELQEAAERARVVPALQPASHVDAGARAGRGSTGDHPPPLAAIREAMGAAARHRQ